MRAFWVSLLGLGVGLGAVVAHAETAPVHARTPQVSWLAPGWFDMGSRQAAVDYARRLCVQERMPDALRLRGCADELLFSDELGERRPFRFADTDLGSGAPPKAAQAARRAVGIGPEEPVRDICGLLEHNGVKLLLLEKKSDAFFGLSVGAVDGGPAVVVNTWDRISVERWIFTAAHELGHLLLHPDEYEREATALPVPAERDADIFASHFLMPEAAFANEWAETRGHPLVVRVLKIKRIFRVSYKTVLHRLVESEREPKDIWRAFQIQHRAHFGSTLRRTEEPKALEKSEFAWKWTRAGEPEGLSEHDFVEDRLYRLVRQALEQERISLGRAAEILGLPREEMRKQVREWVS